MKIVVYGDSIDIICYTNQTERGMAAMLKDSREKPMERKGEGEKMNSRSSLHLTIYNKSIGAGSRCVPRVQYFSYLREWFSRFESAFKCG